MAIDAKELRIGNYMGYVVSSDGVILSKRSNRKLAYSENSKGYPCVMLSVNGRNIQKRVHRIMAELFIPNPENKPQVNHKNRNRADFSLENLEWCTASENAIHSVLNGARDNWYRENVGADNGNAKLKWGEVCNIREMYNAGNYSQGKLAVIFNTTQSRISKIIHYKSWKSASTGSELTIQQTPQNYE